MTTQVRNWLLGFVGVLGLVAALIQQCIPEDEGGAGGAGGVAGSAGSATAGTGGSGGEVASAGSGGAPSGGTGTGGSVTTGWNEYTPSSDSRIVYVSTTGSDSNNGLAPENPVASPAAGYALLRDGFPDHLLFKRGDVWTNGVFPSWKKSGRSASERMVVNAYGSGARPRFEVTQGWLTAGGGGAPTSVNNLAFVSLNTYLTTHDPARGTPTGRPHCVNWNRGLQNVRFEDMRFEWCQVNFEAIDGAPFVGLHFFRSLFLDSYAVELSPGNVPHAQGLYVDNLPSGGGMRVEESVFDYCGWYPLAVPGTEPTIFNHCMYLQEDDPHGIVVKGNVVMRASSHGAQLRSGGTLEGNAFIANPIGAFIGGQWHSTAPPASGAFQAIATGNLFTATVDSIPRTPHTSPAILRGWGFEINEWWPHGLPLVRIENNIVSHCDNSSASTCQSLPTISATSPGSPGWSGFASGSVVAGNTVWDVGNTRSGYQADSAGPFVDPNRSIASYSASIGNAATLDAFATELRKQAKGNWREAYTAPAIIQYFRAGLTAP